MLKTAYLTDGKQSTRLNYEDGADLLEMLRLKGWKPEQGDLLKLPGDIEVLRERDVPPGNEVHLELVRKSQGMPEDIQKQLEARINKLSLEVKEARTERNIALITSQKEKEIGQGLYDAAKASSYILDEIGLPPVSAEHLASAQAVIAGFYQQLKNVESLAEAKTARRVIGKDKRSKRKLEPVLERAVQQVQQYTGEQSDEEEEECQTLSASQRMEEAVQQVARSSGLGMVTRSASGSASRAAKQSIPEPGPSTPAPASSSGHQLPRGTSLEDLVLVPAGEKLDEAAHMQPIAFAILKLLASAVGSVLHLADTHAKDGFAQPSGYIDCSCLASDLRAWTQLVVAIEFKLSMADMVAALGQLVGRFRNTVDQQQGRTFMLGLGITLQTVEVFYFEMKEESELHVKRSGPLPLDFSSGDSAGLMAIARVLAADFQKLGFNAAPLPPTMDFISETTKETLTVHIQQLVRVGTAAAHRASRVFLADLPDGRKAVVKENPSSREVDILRLLVPPHARIVRLEGVAGDEGNTRVLLTPFAQLLTWHSETPLVIQVAFDVVCALEYLELKKVAHRDVSPFNFGEIAGRGVLFDFSASKEVCAPPSPSDELENITWTPVAASLGLLEGEKAAATDDLEALFHSMYYIVTGGHILGGAAFSSGNVSEMAAARRGSTFVRVLPGLGHVKERTLVVFLTDLFRIFFPAGSDGRTARYRRDVKACELQSVCKRHLPGLLED